MVSSQPPLAVKMVAADRNAVRIGKFPARMRPTPARHRIGATFFTPSDPAARLAAGDMMTVTSAPPSSHSAASAQETRIFSSGVIAAPTGPVRVGRDQIGDRLGLLLLADRARREVAIW